MSNAAHLDDVMLNEYLDEVLERSARTDVEAHLAHCPDCSTRLLELRTLFADLESLPDLPLERDLTPSVLAVARRKSRPQTLASPALGLIFALQTVASIFLLGLALPLFAQPLQSFTTFQFGEQLSILLANLLAILSGSWPALLTAAQNLVSESVSFVQPIQTLPFISEASLMICLSAVFLLWLLGNGLLLRPRRVLGKEQVP
jgi:anti-sigma factor RsiW